MMAEFLTFQKYNDLDLANIIANLLTENGLECYVENDQKLFDVSFSFNTISSDILLKLKSEDFNRAHQILENYYQKDLENVDKDYYLLQFTDRELMDIVAKPDEWRHFDYQLAKKLLKEKGKEIIPEKEVELKTQRIEQLAKPEKTDET